MRDPAGAFAPILVKSTQEMFGVLLAYTSDSLGNDEIFFDWFFSGTQNLSNSLVQDQRPEIFLLNGFGFSVYELIVVWESYHNGHWQLWYSYMDNAGGVEPVEPKNPDLLGVPNPFHNRLTLEFALSEDQEVRFKIMNSLGILLVETPVIQGHTGQNTLDITPYIQGDGKGLKSGLYFIEMNSKTDKKTIKMIKN
jgi:hypothetical protein